MSQRPEALFAPEAAGLRLAGWLSVLAGLIWLPQAWCAARVLAGLLEALGPGARLDQSALIGFLICGFLRALIQDRAEDLAQRRALEAVGRLRAEVLERESLRGVLRPAGALASVLSEQVEMLRPFAARYLMARLRVMVLPLAVLVASLTVSWAAALILLVTGPVVPVFMALIGQAAARASRAQLDQMGTIGARLADHIAALPDIRLLGARAAFLADFEAAAVDLQKRSMRVLGIAFLSSTVLELFAAIGVAMMAIYCGFSLLGLVSFGLWQGAMSPAAGIFLLLLAPDFYQPLRDLAAVWHDRASAEAVAEVLAEGAGEADMLGQGGPAAELSGVIELRGVTRHGIRYPDFSFAPGESLALTGPSGAGKTTLLRLIAGLEAPDAGQILVAGAPLDASSADPWRAGIGWMAQMPHFLDDSLGANLAMGRLGDLDAVLALAAADRLVAGLPDGLSHRLGESGSGVSGGEARRLTLARALWGQPRLILADEPSADLDRETADLVSAGLMAAHRNGAGLIIATHDGALAARMSRQIVLGAPQAKGAGDGEQ